VQVNIKNLTDDVQYYWSRTYTFLV